MLAPYDQPDGLLKLLELLTGMTIDVVETYAAMGTVDALFTAEDWGLQTSLQMNIDTFREFYKPFYFIFSIT
jgi:uroporphyrinogen-III decarboxylase